MNSLGAEIVYDLTECLAKNYISGVDQIFEQALDEVGHEVVQRIKSNPSLKYTAMSALDVAKSQIDFKGVTSTARTYVEQQKAEIYGVTGFKMWSAFPTGLIVGFYHPVLDKIPMDQLTAKMGLPAKSFPFIGVIVVPTCYQSIGPNGVPSKIKTRFRFGALANLMWRIERTDPNQSANEPPAQVSGGAAPTSPFGNTPRRLVLGFTWGSLYDPAQLNGAIFGFGIGRGMQNPATTPEEISNIYFESVPTRHSKVPVVQKDSPAKSWGMALRPLVVIGSKAPPTPGGSVNKTFEFVKNIFGGSLNITDLSPTHFMLLADIFGSQTRKSYVNFYGGVNIVNTSIIESFFERPIMVDSSGTISAGTKEEETPAENSDAGTKEPVTPQE